MTSKQKVIRFCDMRGLTLCRPTKGSPDIIVTEYKYGFGHHVADGLTWADVEAKLVQWNMARLAA